MNAKLWPNKLSGGKRGWAFANLRSVPYFASSGFRLNLFLSPHGLTIA